MSEPKGKRIPAGDVGTSDRIAGDQGHYWVRLVTRQAIKREGEAMQNCLRGSGYERFAGPETYGDSSLWSLRGEDGLSVALVETQRRGHTQFPPLCITDFKGPFNNLPSPLAYRQLGRLMAVYEKEGFPLSGTHMLADPAVVAPSGETYRWDKAPPPLRLKDHDERIARRLAEAEDARRRRREAEERRRELANQPPIPATPDPWDQPQPVNPNFLHNDVIRNIEEMIEGLPEPVRMALLDGRDGLEIRTFVNAHDEGLTILINDARFFVGRRRMTEIGFMQALETTLLREALPVAVPAQEFVEIRSNEHPGRPVIATLPLPTHLSGDLEARIVTEHRVDDWCGDYL